MFQKVLQMVNNVSATGQPAFNFKISVTIISVSIMVWSIFLLNQGATIYTCITI